MHGVFASHNWTCPGIVGLFVGTVVDPDGLVLGEDEGERLGDAEGDALGPALGLSDGLSDGDRLGDVDGLAGKLL